MHKLLNLIKSLKTQFAPKNRDKIAIVKKAIVEHQNYLIFIFLTAGLYFIRMFSKIIFFKPDGFYAGHQNVWSDWALHITITNTFANKPLSEWFLYHPYFAGGKLTYPFLTHIISALLMKIGFNITTAMIWPSIIMILLLLMGMYFLYFQIIKSKIKALLGIFIFLTSAGPGFIFFIKELINNPSFQILAYPPIDYTRIIEYQWLAGNIPTAMLIPQKAFLIGITIATWSILLFTIAIQQKPLLRKSKDQQKRLFIISGLLAGILPIAHMHSFIAVIFITGFLCLTKLKNTIYYFIPAALLSSILYLVFVNGGIERPDFMKISIGWTSEPNFFAWLNMWWSLWGVMIPVAIYSIKMLYQNKKTKSIAKYFIGYFALFIIANIVVFQPTEWDNTKLFAWVYFGFSLLAAHLIIELWNNKIIYKIIAILLLIMISTTGSLELIRLQRFDKNTHMLNTIEDIKFAKYVMANTKTDDVFLTSSIHNHPIQMWGSRSIVMGYTGWIANFGFDYAQRASDIRNIFENPADSANLITKYNVNYIVIGQSELNEFVVDEEYFKKMFPLKFQSNQMKIYELKK